MLNKLTKLFGKILVKLLSICLLMSLAYYFIPRFYAKYIEDDLIGKTYHRNSFLFCYLTALFYLSLFCFTFLIIFFIFKSYFNNVNRIIISGVIISVSCFLIFQMSVVGISWTYPLFQIELAIILIFSFSLFKILQKDIKKLI